MCEQENTSATTCASSGCHATVLRVPWVWASHAQLIVRYGAAEYAAKSLNVLQALGKITKEGVFLEQLERNPAQYLPEVTTSSLSADVREIGGSQSLSAVQVVRVDLNQPMDKIRALLSQYPIRSET